MLGMTSMYHLSNLPDRCRACDVAVRGHIQGFLIFGSLYTLQELSSMFEEREPSLWQAYGLGHKVTNTISRFKISLVESLHFLAVPSVR